jgi:hypothetical protein
VVDAAFAIANAADPRVNIAATQAFKEIFFDTATREGTCVTA